MNRYSENKTFRTINNNLRNRGLRYYNTSRYPLVPLSEDDIYAISEFGDRLETLAYQFYGDVTLYWIIAIANPNIIPFDSLFIPVGSQIRIPQDISSIIDSYNELNR
jgi:hypothetical protein|tara:strand:- start:416 stop:736 length:321 start_codon:yes stop_codon:yes gene_type:complete